MPEFIGLEQMYLPLENKPPTWYKYWGKDFRRDYIMLDKVFEETLGQPLEERNKLLKIVKEDVIGIRNRWRDLADSERNEAWALCEKYNKPETGLFAELTTENKALMADLEARFPSLVECIKWAEEYYGPVVQDIHVKVLDGNDTPIVVFNNARHRVNFRGDLEIKAMRDMRTHLIKKASLLEEQTQILTRALEENGIQIPREFTAIQSHMDVCKRSGPDEPAQVEEDPCPAALQVAMVEDHTGSAFTAGYVRVEVPERTPTPPPPPPPVEMSRDELEELINSMYRFKSSKCFKTPATEKRPSKYFDVVREPRDLVTIYNVFSKNAWYRAEAFFNDIRLMLDNYSHFFGEGSDEHKMVELFQVAMFKKLEGYGEAGQTAKDQFNRAPRATFNDSIPSPKADETLPPSDELDPIDDSDYPDEAETSFAQGLRDNWEDDYGEGCDDSYFGRNEDVLDYGDETGLQPKTPGTVGPAHKFGSRGGHAHQSPSFRGPAEQPGGEDDPLNRAWDAFDMAKGYDQWHGHATRAPARRKTAWPHDDEDGRSSPAPGPSRTAQQPDDNDSDILSYITSPVPSPSPQPEAAAGESGDEAAHAGTHAFEQPAPVAPMYAEGEVIGISPSPQRQTAHVDSASTKRGRAPDDDQDFSSDDDAPLVKRRRTIAEPLSIKEQKTAAESPRYAVAPSLGKRSRDDNDDDDEEEREQTSKRNKVSSPSALEPQAPMAAAAGDGGPDDTSLTVEQLFEPFDSPLRPVQEPPAPVAAAAPVGEPSLANIENLLRVIRNDEVAPSPIPEPITPPIAAADGPGSASPPPASDRQETPKPANDASDTGGHESKQGSSSSSAAADEPPPEPATEDLGHTENGTITVSKMHRLPKYKKKRGSKEKGPPNRPWVFGYWFDNEYGLYIMGCPKKGCETAPEIFTTHPLMRNDAADHLQECGYDFTDDDDMVRKYCTQVISDEKKAVTIEWARKWNKDLMKEYDDEDRDDENF